MGDARDGPSTILATSGPASPTTDLRYRHREADLWANPGDAHVAANVAARWLARCVKRCWAQGFVEVETPILNAIASGSDARPFATHHNALDSDYFLRIAPELWLKRLVVGGLRAGLRDRSRLSKRRCQPPVTTLSSRCWRSTARTGNYEDMMTFTEELTAGVAMDVLGTTEVEYQGRPFSFAAPWPRRTMAELASEAVGEEVSVHTPREKLASMLRRARCGGPPGVGFRALPRRALEATAEAALWNPIFVTDFPVRDLAAGSTTPERPGPRRALRVLRRWSANCRTASRNSSIS